MRVKNLMYVLFLAAVAAGLAVFLLGRQDEGQSASVESPATARSEQRQDELTTRPENAVPDEGVRERKRRKPRLHKNAIDKRTRAEVLALILAALQEQERKTKEKYSKESLKPTGLPAEYIREAVKEVRPLFKECYHMELEERGVISGRLVFEFEIIADDEHGGLVEEVKIAETELSKEISDSFAECLRETIYSLRFDSAMQAGRHTVRYPVIFRAAQ
jgi:hypothetical protein